ncbi:heterokaryon incompatibility protein-domain-containing protein [Fusarium oxysporum]|nr:heterokaryon incompatibility protein-domain-containing protein [Fusarium oxysporum]
MQTSCVQSGEKKDSIRSPILYLGDGRSSRLLEVEITANGITFMLSISGNLDAALRALRRSDVPRLVWADAICINQDDIKERGEQVRMMGQIFSGAFQVVIWLGEDEDYCFGSQTLLASSLSSFAEAFSRTCSLVNEWLAKSGSKDTKATYSKVSADGYSTSRHSKNDSDIRISSQDRESAEQGRLTRSTLLWLFERRWFSRVWVIQESVLARHAVVQFGSYQISWNWIGIAAALIVNNPMLTPDGLERETIPTGVSNAYLMLSFAQLLQVTRQFHCKEPRDKVYGLLGLQTTDSITERVTPDYSSETSTEGSMRT